MCSGVRPNAAFSAQRFDGSKKPGFVLSMGKHYFARDVGRFLAGPTEKPRRQLGGTIIVAIKKNENRARTVLYAG